MTSLPQNLVQYVLAFGFMGWIDILSVDKSDWGETQLVKVNGKRLWHVVMLTVQFLSLIQEGSSKTTLVIVYIKKLTEQIVFFLKTRNMNGCFTLCLYVIAVFCSRQSAACLCFTELSW